MIPLVQLFFFHLHTATFEQGFIIEEGVWW